MRAGVYACTPSSRLMHAGTPANNFIGPKERVTTLPAATTHFAPRLTPGNTMLPAQSQQPSPTSTSREHSTSAIRSRSGVMPCVPFPINTLGAMSTFLPIRTEEEALIRHRCPIHVLSPISSSPAPTIITEEQTLPSYLGSCPTQHRPFKCKAPRFR